MSPPAPRRLPDATWVEIDWADRPPAIVVPVGSCEQHGPHLPLGTDTIVAEALATALVAVPDCGLVLAPALGITASGEHQGFPGTLSIGSAVLTSVVVELVRSADWSAGVVLVNGHGGNAEAIGAAVRTLRGEGRRVLSWWPPGVGVDSHAGRNETELLLAIAPHLVRTDRAAAGRTEPLAELLPAVRAGGVRAVSANGVLGDPAGATATGGAALLAAFTADLVTTVTRWLAGG
jgi:mycofactocin precursor peptide peptidase